MLFSPLRLGAATLAHRVVMAPLTRMRAGPSGVPGPMNALYYGQRASRGGLLIAEATPINPQGHGHPDVPGIHTREQVDGWRLVTEAVHAKGGLIYLQLWHTGRTSHSSHQPDGGAPFGPSAIAGNATGMTRDWKSVPYETPRAMTAMEIAGTVAAYAQGARNAIAAGFDGVEIHGANGYLLEQFLNPASNQRTDQYGGSAENRNRFVLEVAEAVASAIGKEKTAIRLSPFGTHGEMVSDENTEEQFTALAEGLQKIGIVYIHVVDHSALGAPAVPDSVKKAISTSYTGTIIISGGYDAARAEADLEAGKGELVAFGRPFISNPDLVERLRTGAELETPDHTTFYTPGEKGYTDYKVLAAV